jgi:hypothetical protein
MHQDSGSGSGRPKNPMDPKDPDPQHCSFAWKISLFYLASNTKHYQGKTGISTFSQLDQKYEDLCDIKKIFFVVGL